MNNSLARFYRGYQIPWGETSRTKGKKIVYVLPNANFFLPRRFLWVGEGDTDLEDYIDALVDRRQLVSMRYEERELAIDQVYEEKPPERTITLSTQLILSFLRGELPLEVPCGTKIRIRDPEGVGRLVTTGLDAAIGDTNVLELYKQAIIECAATGKGLWLEERIASLKAIQNASETERQDFNLAAAEEHGTPVVTVDIERPAPQPPPEETISTRQKGIHTEVISAVMAEPPYFVKRVFDEEGNQLRALSAWCAEGPWR